LKSICLFVSIYFIIVFPLTTAQILSSTKEYNESTKTYAIKDENSVNIAKIKLNSPLKVYVIRGKNRQVAEFSIENYKDLAFLPFNDMEFIDLANNLKFSRQFSYKYKIPSIRYENYTYEECDWKDVEFPKGNLTKDISNCSKITREISYDDSKWVSLDMGTIFPKGNITIGVFTEVFPDEQIEWVATLYGERLDQWAVWTEALNVQLFGYYDYNQGAGDIIERVSGAVNLTTFNAPPIVAGIINNASSFDGINMHDRNDTGFNTQIRAFSLWFKPDNNITTSTGPQTIINLRGDDAYGIRIGDATGVCSGEIITFMTATARTCWANTTLQGGHWYHLVANYNGTNSYELWLDGIKLSYTSSGTMSVITTTEFTIARDRSAGGVCFYDGTVDEIALWNRSLTQAEITQLYNNGLGITYNKNPDSTPPNISIVYPPNNTNSSNFNLNVNFTVSDNVAISSCWWTDDNGATNTSNPTCLNLTGAWVEGINNVTIYVNDTSNNVNFSSVSFRIDATPPSFLNLTNQSFWSNQSLDYDINASDSGVGLGTFWINWTTIFSINSTTGLLTNISSLLAFGGEHYINITINDTLGNMNSTVLLVNISIYPTIPKTGQTGGSTISLLPKKEEIIEDKAQIFLSGGAVLLIILAFMIRFKRNREHEQAQYIVSKIKRNKPKKSREIFEEELG